MTGPIKELQYPTSVGRDASFRHDINGLRAVAVVAVVLFHFEVRGFSGGFIGVDVFFAISGFLITGMVLRGLDAGVFSYSRFLWTRFLRIYPPMLAMIAVCLALGYFFLAPEEFTALGERAVASVASLCNLLYYRDAADYFAQATQGNGLLHLWSLAVECQFYLVFPLFLATVYRATRSIAWVLLGGALVSFGACVVVTGYDQPAAFYMMPTRMWQFLAGALAFFVLPKVEPRWRLSFSVAGVAVIIASAMAFGNVAFPGYLAAIPVLGASLVLAAPSRNLILVNRVSDFLGRISYSLYLWHWPVWIAVKHYGIDPTIIVAVSAFTISITLGSIAYYLVEKPCGKLRRAVNPVPGFASLATASLAVATFGGYVAMSDGIPQRVPQIIREAVSRFNVENASLRRPKTYLCYLLPEQTALDLDDRCFRPGTAEGGANIFVWGDSYAEHLYNGFANSTEYAEEQLGRATNGSCPPLPDVATIYNPACPANVATILSTIEAVRPETVVLFARWGYYKANGTDVVAQLQQTVSALRDAGIRVVIVGPVPEWLPTLPQKLLTESFASGGILAHKLADASHVTDERLDARMAALAKESGVEYVSLFELWCAEGVCTTIVGPEDRPDLTVYDYGHLTVTAAGEVVKSAFPQSWISSSDP